MSKPKQTVRMVLGIGLVALGSVCAAQTSAAQASEAATPTEKAPQAGTSPQALLAQAKGSMTHIDSAAAVISRMLRDARHDKDVVKVMCLDDKLNQIDVAKRTVGERVDAMELAVSAGTTDSLEFEMAVIGALEERANTLAAEAQQCIGEEKGFAGGSKLEYKQIDKTIPTQDVSAPPSSPVASAPPVAASPVY